MTLQQETPDRVDRVEAATMALFARMYAPGTGPGERRRLREEIISSNLPLATRLTRRYRHRGQDDDVLAQVAALALVKAVDGFDPGRGKPFFGYLIPTVTGELKRHFRDKGWRVHVGRHLQERCLELGHVRAELGQTLRRPPTIAELAQALGGTEDEVLEAWMAASAYDVDSLNARVSDADDAAELQDLMGQEDADLAGACDRLALRDLLRRLPELEQYVVTRYFFGDATQEQIAQSLGVSQMHVSRLLRRTLQALHRQLDGDETGPAPATTAQVTASTTSGRTVVAVAGDLDQASAARLRDKLVDTAVRTRPRLLVVDLTRAGHADGATVRALVDGHRATGHSGTAYMVIGVPPALFERLRRLGVTRLFPCRPAHQAAAAPVVAAEPVAEPLIPTIGPREEHELPPPPVPDPGSDNGRDPRPRRTVRTARGPRRAVARGDPDRYRGRGARRERPLARKPGMIRSGRHPHRKRRHPDRPPPARSP
ncbi:SigB/SigF/SigG family RNA polymerase sigma factor [Paractinoplanes rhizophilus]|uniref:SigB/SigF/SigG family RNA polymerase sigma factor n=1 Tax=Paractinoplanes rhizophilus TaxID=1416877 RepID=A0ABW2I360_9ACTN